MSLLLFSSCGGGGGAKPLLVVAEADTESGLTVSFLGIYTNNIITVDAGDPVSLQVQRGGTSVSGTVVMPAQPSVSEPGTGPYDRNDPLTVSWSLAATPQQVVVQVKETYTADLDGYTQILGGLAVTWDIPPNTFKDANQTGVTVQVGAVSSTTLSGSGIVSGSMLAAANIASSPAFDMNQ